MGNAPSSDATLTTTTGSLISNSPVTNTNVNSTVTATVTPTFTPRISTIAKKVDDETTVTKTATTDDDDTTFDFLDDEVEIGDYKIKYKYIIGGVLLMVLLMKK